MAEWETKDGDLVGVGVDDDGRIWVSTREWGDRVEPTDAAMTPDECERLICDLARALAEVAPDRVASVDGVHVAVNGRSGTALALGLLVAQGATDGE